MGMTKYQEILYDPAVKKMMTIHPQDELGADPSIQRTTARRHDAYLGVFASIGTPGHSLIGDPV